MPDIVIPDDLHGEFSFAVSDQHADFFIRNLVVVLVEQTVLPGIRYAAWTNLNRSALTDSYMVVAAQQLALERLRPWARRDRNPMPSLDLFPNFTRSLRFAQRVGARAVGFALPRRKDGR